MPTKDTSRRPSGRRQPSRTPSKRLAAVPSRESKQPGSRPAALAARLRRKRSRATPKPRLLATVGNALGDRASGVTQSARGAGKKSLAALLTGGGALAATAAFIRRRGRQRQPQPPASEPEPQNTAPTTHQQEGDGQPAGDTTSTPPV
jgi:hypothetical protein